MSQLSHEELETLASQHLGRLLIIFGRLELDVSLALAHLCPPEHLDTVIVEIEKQSFGGKLEALRQRVEAIDCDDAAARTAWLDWYEAAKGLRTLRNRFAHGRWGFVVSQETIAHVSGVPGGPNDIETRYTLTQLAHEVDKATRIAAGLSRLRDRSPALFY